MMYSLPGRTPRTLSSVHNSATLEKMTDMIYVAGDDGLSFEDVEEQFKKMKDTWNFPGGFRLHLLYIWKMLIKQDIICLAE